MAHIFDFKSYKDFLEALTGEERGMLTRLAEAASCQKSYLSTCIKGKTHLTLDHAFGISEFLNFSDAEREYFFLLIEKDKAGSLALRRHLESKIKQLSREAYRLKNQQKNAVIVSGSETAEIAFYYGTYLGTAIHMLTSIPEFQTVNAIAKRLNISPEVCLGVLQQLEAQQLVKKQGAHHLWNSANIHLADNSPWILNHHQNWRLRAVDNVQKRDDEATHYSSIQSMSKEDFEKLKKKIVQFIKDFNLVADPSNPEEAFCLNIDFFKV
jgi:uncharacterized protein (TIGR02147 family)